jgi:hypothetical protein
MQCHRFVRLRMSLILVAAIAAGVNRSHAQDTAKPKEAPKLGWSNTSDLSLVVTGGNSESTTLGLSDKLRYRWQDARLELEVNVVRARTSDDRFFQVDPGIEFPVGGAPSSPPSSLMKPEPTLDVANYLLRGGYERQISPRWLWNAGASWYRNDDAGIVNRYITYAGIGNTWVDTTRRRFVTSYGFSYTDREENEPDPEKDRRFAGARAGWNYAEHFTPAATFESDFASNVNLSDRSDFSIDTTNSLTVSVASRVSIKVSLQWLLENEPALESDLDVVAFVDVVNPDGLPGTGDELLRTVASSGTKLVLGSSSARKDKLDTIVKTALVIKF